MKFTELSEEQFRNYFNISPLKTFLQTPEIGKLRQSNGWSTHFVGVIENDEVIAASMLLSKPEFRGHLEFYAPRGLLLNYQNAKLLQFFVTELKKYIQQRYGYILRIDPYLIKQQRDINGDIVKNGIDNRNIITELESLGFIKSEHNEQIVWAFSLDLDGKSTEQILKEMKANTRSRIKKTHEFGVTVRELGLEELNKFKEITESTSERRSFMDKPLHYYEDMYRLFHDKQEIRYLLAEINLADYTKKLNDELEDTTKKIKELPDSPSNRGKLKDLKILSQSLEKKLIDAKKMQKENKNDILVLSGAMFMTVGDEIIYLFSGTKGEYMMFNGQYAIQWDMIQYGIEHGYKKYNFYGISGNFDKHHPEYGIYEFKKGFNGYVEETIGEYELPIGKHYKAFKRTTKLKRAIKKLVRK